MDLADKLINKLERSPEIAMIGKDNLGLPAPDHHTVDYICARVLKQHPDIYKHKGRLYDGHTQIREDKLTLISYNGATDKFIKPDTTVLIWDKIRELVPELSFDKITISPHLVWDVRKGELEWLDTE